MPKSKLIPIQALAPSCNQQLGPWPFLPICHYVIYEEVWGRGENSKGILKFKEQKWVSVPLGIYKGRWVISPELVGAFGGGRGCVPA